MFLLRLAPVCFRQHQGQHVEEVMVESLADKDEQLWNEFRLFRKHLKPKQVLHVGILLNGLDGVLIAQFSTCFTISAPTTMRAGLLPAPL